METLRAARRGAVGLLFGIGCVACSAILGIDDLPPATDGGVPGTSGIGNVSNQGASGGSHASTATPPPGQSTSAAGMTGTGATSVVGGSTGGGTTGASMTSGGSTPRPGTSSSVVMTGGSSSSSSAPATCNAGTAGIALNNGYQTALGEGYCYSYSDSSSGCEPCGTSTACLSPGNLCAEGTAAGYNATAANYGGGLGCNVSQTMADAGPATVNPLQLTGGGITYTLSSLPPNNAVTMTLDVGGTEYYCSITSTSGTCYWSDFRENSTLSYLTAAPATTHVQFQVSSTSVSETWDLCVLSIGIAAATTGSGSSGIGDPCTTAGDCFAGYSCLSATGSGNGFCTASCATDSDCPGAYTGGLNGQGTANACIEFFNQTAQADEDRCFPECTGVAECSSFSSTTCTTVVNSTGDADVDVCYF